MWKYDNIYDFLITVRAGYAMMIQFFRKVELSEVSILLLITAGLSRQRRPLYCISTYCPK